MTRHTQTETLRVIQIQDAVQRRREMALLASEIGVFEFEPATQKAFWDHRIHQMWGIPDGQEITYDTVIKGLHPDDRDFHDRTTEAALDPAGSGHLDMTYRVIPLDGSPMRWVRAVASCYFEGETPVRLVGTVQDVTAEKKQMARNAMLLNELQHRVKNTFATAIAVIDLSRQGQVEVDPFFDAIKARLRAMARSHDALQRADWTDVDLMDCISREASGFLGPDNPRLRVSGPPLHIPATHVQTFNMVIHELFTNAAKHGALRNKFGRIDIQTDIKDGMAQLSWTEHSPEPIVPPSAAHQGFGTVLIDGILATEIDAKVSRDLSETGLQFTLQFPNLKDPS